MSTYATINAYSVLTELQTLLVTYLPAAITVLNDGILAAAIAAVDDTHIDAIPLPDSYLLTHVPSERRAFIAEPGTVLIGRETPLETDQWATPQANRVMIFRVDVSMLAPREVEAVAWGELVPVALTEAIDARWENGLNGVGWAEPTNSDLVAESTDRFRITTFARYAMRIRTTRATSL